MGGSESSPAPEDGSPVSCVDAPCCTPFSSTRSAPLPGAASRRSRDSAVRHGACRRTTRCSRSPMGSPARWQASEDDHPRIGSDRRQHRQARTGGEETKSLALIDRACSPLCRVLTTIGRESGGSELAPHTRGSPEVRLGECDPRVPYVSQVRPPRRASERESGLTPAGAASKEKRH